MQYTITLTVAIGRDPPKYISTFEECDFFETTRKNIASCNYTRPTPVQKYAIPIIGAKRDLMACAQTGSGKTVSLVMIINIIEHSNTKHRDF